METVEHPRIRPGEIEDRLYQRRIAEAAVDRNTLVVLPTGLGKTAIAVRVIAEHLARHPTRSVLLMAPTRPLVVQHGRTLGSALLGPPPVVLTGSISPERRRALLAPPQIVVATPQVVGNDLANGEFPFASFSVVVFDEAHRAVGNYPYVAIGRANAQGPGARVLAMTASPGSRIATIREVWANLGIEHVEYRTASDPDVVPYVHGIGVELVEVDVPAEVQHLAIRLRAVLARQVERLVSLGQLPERSTGRRPLLEVGRRLHAQVGGARARGESAPASLWSAVTAQAAAMKAAHAVELVETQGVEALRAFLGRQHGLSKSPALQAFLGDPDTVEVETRLRAMTLEHPKVERAISVLRDQLGRASDSRAILFTQYRQTADVLLRELEALHDPAVRAARFVGQASHGEDLGMTQKEQVERLAEFRSGTINCLVATSVAEEGLDVPSTDLVVFYEPVADVIRAIQRRGRTGRSRSGRVLVLVAKGTRDVGLQSSISRKERRMHDLLESIEAESRAGPVRPPPLRTVQSSLEEYEGAQRPRA